LRPKAREDLAPASWSQTKTNLIDSVSLNQSFAEYFAGEVGPKNGPNRITLTRSTPKGPRATASRPMRTRTADLYRVNLLGGLGTDEVE